IREFVTINPATAKGNKTVIGDGNLLMAYCHVGHDCVIGSNNIFANAATLAGHVTIEDKTVIGGLAGIHQFVKVGKYSIIGGCSKVSHDVLPFSMLDGNPGKTQGLNLVGLRRANFSNDSVVQLKKALDILLDKNRLLEDALRDLSNSFTDDVNVNYLIDFVRSSKRGIGR
ncbi:MAG: acyl-[acyl-carrier-protein]--UDP-N-acetylglucosamine O-acyltransferase, partial [Candidatus Omnitrophica bacterium]|nr:acyl-[acyl-carrier-protein]--UDP-N-acetylglucosamine O-acyltransferase [Candidatus Omnitrophota bacterium]